MSTANACRGPAAGRVQVRAGDLSRLGFKLRRHRPPCMGQGAQSSPPRLTAVPAVFVAVFIFKANLYPPPGSIVIAITSLIIVAVHVPAATDRRMIPVLLVRHSPRFVGLRAVETAFLCSPIASYLEVISALRIVPARFFRLLRGALWLDRNSQGRVRSRSISSLFGETRGYTRQQ
jgi:hypothetical protein